jgi:hypothetical protein
MAAFTRNRIVLQQDEAELAIKALEHYSAYLRSQMRDNWEFDLLAEKLKSE